MFIIDPINAAIVNLSYLVETAETEDRKIIREREEEVTVSERRTSVACPLLSSITSYVDIRQRRYSQPGAHDVAPITVFVIIV